MDKQELLDKIAAGVLTRREFQKVLVSLGLLAATVPVTSRRVGAAEDILYFTWGGYDVPNIHEGYVEKYGGPPAYALFGEEEEAFQKMRAGYIPDVAHPCTYSVGRWRDSGLMAPIDTTRLENYPDIWDRLKSLEIAQADGATWFVPFDWGNSSVLYRTDLVDPSYQEEGTWELLFDERYRGQLGVYDSVDGAVIVAALVAGVNDPFAMTDDELAEVRELMAKQRPLLRFYWTDQTAVEQGLASGELVAAYAWNSSAVLLKEEGIPVKYMNPKEGILTWVCGMMILKDGPGDEQAKYDFIDAMIAPESGQWLIENYGYGHSNRKAFDLVSDGRLAELEISTPEALFAQGVFFQDIAPDVRQKYIAMFEEVKAGG